MPRENDLILMLVIFGSMAWGIFAPSVGTFLRPYPLYFMMFLLFLSFLSIELPDIGEALAKRWGISIWLAVFKLLILPVLVFFILKVTFPAFALAGLLLSGVSTGVVAPFIATLVGANEPLVLLLVVATSLLTPFTLPLVVKFLAGRNMEISIFAMMRMLAMVIFIPIFLVELLRRTWPPVSSFLLRYRYPTSLVIFAAINLGVFSKYSRYFHQRPGSILSAILMAFFLGGLYFVLGISALWKSRVDNQVASAIILVNVNNVLIIVFAAQFFGPLEATLAALYMIPFFLVIFPLKQFSLRKQA